MHLFVAIRPVTNLEIFIASVGDTNSLARRTNPHTALVRGRVVTNLVSMKIVVV